MSKVHLQFGAVLAFGVEPPNDHRVGPRSRAADEAIHVGQIAHCSQNYKMPSFFLLKHSTVESLLEKANNEQHANPVWSNRCEPHNAQSACSDSSRAECPPV